MFKSKEMENIIQHNHDNIQHNYELIKELQKEIEELKINQKLLMTVMTYFLRYQRIFLNKRKKKR